jgi:hypothetical protein
MRVTPTGFDFQRVSLAGSEESLTTPMPSVPFFAARSEISELTPNSRRRGSED